MAYPHLNMHFSQEELIEHFTLTPEERFFLPQWRQEGCVLGCAVLLKTFLFLGYPPPRKDDVPASLVSWLGQQLNLSPGEFESYSWKSRRWNEHLASIRTFTGFRPWTDDDGPPLVQWLVDEAGKHPSRTDMKAAVIQKCRRLKLELPAEKELYRLVGSAWWQFQNNICEQIAGRLGPEIRQKMDQCLEGDKTEMDRYEWMKNTPGKSGLKCILREIERLRSILEFGINADLHLRGIPDETLRQLRDRAAPEGAHQMKRHPPEVRYALMAALLHYRRMEVTDAVIAVFLQLVRRLEKKTDRALEKEETREIVKVYQKRHMLYNVAVAATERPDDPVGEVLYPIVGGKDTFLKVIAEYEGRELVYEKRRVGEKKSRYTRSCRRMMKPVLETLVFRANNPALQPLLDGIALVRKYLDKKNCYYPTKEKAPLELLSGELRELAVEDDEGTSRVVKHYFELGVLMKLEKALRCKEVWVEGAFRYRDPDQDLPQDWPEMRLNYYRQHQIPARAEDFVEPIREELVQALKKADEFFSEKRDVYIYYPGQGQKGFFRIPKIVKGPEHPILQEIKQRTVERWGIQDIADFLLEANRRVNFSRFFYSTAQRQVLTPVQIVERLLISILGRGTGLGLKRVHAATKPSFSYEDLVYFNKRFMHVDSLREAIAALFNCILELRSPEIWGAITACTSDGKYLGAWAQNLVAEWNSHYQQIGALSYWHVDAKAAGIFSQIKGVSEVAAMIAGLIFHGTTMKIGSNYIDTRGQSELAFSFCRFLWVDLCPWLKGMKRQRLALPGPEMQERFPNLAGVLDDPIRWDFAYEQYDDMVRHVVAAKEMTGPIDSIIRRFNRNNPGHPAYKGFLELGQALRTIHDCKFLTDPDYRRQIHSGRNVIENWNSALDFINYAGKAELPTNDPEIQEITVLCLHLLQNAVVLANTVMLERVIYDDGYLSRLKKDDLEALTPLYTSNVNPYGDIRLDMAKPSFLEVQ